MTPQQRADDLLSIWRMQRAVGIPANDRWLPTRDDREFERDLAILRQLMERSK
jgi:hypothetical protein